MKTIFSKEEFILTEGFDVYLKCKGWVDECDGKRIVGGKIEGTDYNSDKDWEKEVYIQKECSK